MRVGTLGLGVNLGLALVLIPRLGPMGAAVAALTAQTLQSSLRIWLLYRHVA